VGSHFVVVGDEPVDLSLELFFGADVVLGREELLQRLMETLDFAAGLGVWT
jgi:hypothetical protein